jgi:hypothetical protein
LYRISQLDRLVLILSHGLLLIALSSEKIKCFVLLWNDLKTHLRNRRLSKQALAALDKEAFAALGKEAFAALGKEAFAALGKEAFAASEQANVDSILELISNQYLVCRGCYRKPLLSFIVETDNPLPWQLFIEDIDGIRTALLDATNHVSQIGREWISPFNAVVTCQFEGADWRAAWLVSRLRCEQLNRFDWNGDVAVDFIQDHSRPLTASALLLRGMEIDFNHCIVKSEHLDFGGKPPHLDFGTNAIEIVPVDVLVTTSVYWRSFPNERWGKFQTGDLINATDHLGTWYESTVICVEATRLHVHYNGWPTRYDEWIPITSEGINNDRIAKYKSKCDRTNCYIEGTVSHQLMRAAEDQRVILRQHIDPAMRTFLFEFAKFPLEIVSICRDYFNLANENVITSAQRKRKMIDDSEIHNETTRK